MEEFKEGKHWISGTELDEAGDIVHFSHLNLYLGQESWEQVVNHRPYCFSMLSNGPYFGNIR